MNMSDKILLLKRYIIEYIDGQIGNRSEIEHSIFRNFINCIVNIIYLSGRIKVSVNSSIYFLETIKGL